MMRSFIFVKMLVTFASLVVVSSQRSEPQKQFHDRSPDEWLVEILILCYELNKKSSGSLESLEDSNALSLIQSNPSDLHAPTHS